jgi:hypothetical protein
MATHASKLLLLFGSPLSHNFTGIGWLSGHDMKLEVKLVSTYDSKNILSFKNIFLPENSKETFYK